MKYKVGDTIKIKEGLTLEKTACFIPAMIQYRGKVAKVTEVFNRSYHLDIDDEEWYWYEDMIESPKSQKYEITVEENTITVTDDKGNTGIAKCSPKDEFDIAIGISIAIDRLKWKPNECETYWSVIFTQDSNVVKYVWCNDDTDRILYEKGLVFKTKEEAMEAADTMLKAIEK